MSGNLRGEIAAALRAGNPYPPCPNPEHHHPPGTTISALAVADAILPIHEREAQRREAEARREALEEARAAFRDGHAAALDVAGDVLLRRMCDCPGAGLPDDQHAGDGCLGLRAKRIIREVQR